MKRIAYILTIMLQVVFGLLGVGAFTSCSDDDILSGGGKYETLYLRLNVGVPESSRTRGRASATRAQNEPDYYSPTTNNEKISTLRIIIARPDGRVEINTCANVNYLEQVRTDLYKVMADEQKTIYVIANETEAMSALLSEYQPGTDETPGKPVDESLTEYVLGSTDIDGTNRPIPMSAVYKMSVYNTMDSNGDQTLDAVPQIQLLRSATKFTIDVTNKLSAGGTLRVSNVKINSVADKEYLFGHVTDNGGNTLLHSMTIDQTYTVRETATGKAPVVTGGDQAPDDMSYTDHYHDTYRLTSDVSHAAMAVSPAAGASYLEVAQGATGAFPSFYACESMPDEGSAQPFSITLDVSDAGGNKLGTFTRALPNLPRMPRNTHVVIHVNVNLATLECNVYVEPYIGVTLNPVFGINVPRLRLVSDQGAVLGDQSATNRELVVPPGSVLHFKVYDETNADVTDRVRAQQADSSSPGGWEFVFSKKGDNPADIIIDEDRRDFMVLYSSRPGEGTLTVRWMGDDGVLRKSTLKLRIGDMRLVLDSYERYLPINMSDTGTEVGGIQYNKRKLTASFSESVEQTPGTKIQWSIGTNDGTCRYFTIAPSADGMSCQIVPKTDTDGKNIPGTAMVIASYTLANNEVIKDSCCVSLIEPFIELETPTRTFRKNETFSLSYNLIPANYFSADDQVVDNNIRWESSNTAVAVVDPITGEITTKGNGDAVIKVYTYIFGTEEGGAGPRVWATSDIHVGEIVTIHKKGETKAISTILLNANDANQPIVETHIDGNFASNVTWKSSDENVLKLVSQGDGRVKLQVVSTKSAGGVFIYAITPSGTRGVLEVGILGIKTTAKKRPVTKK